MSRIIFDIETLGFPIDSFDQESQTYLLRFADTDEKIEDVRLSRLRYYAEISRLYE